MNNMTGEESNATVIITYSDAQITKITLPDIRIIAANAIIHTHELYTTHEEHKFAVQTDKNTHSGMKAEQLHMT